ncbi:MAG: hypothetical protein WBM27_12225 [bacterium]
MKSAVNLTLIVFVIALTGCSCRPFTASKSAAAVRTIQATAKITSPRKIVTAPIFIVFPTEKSVRIDVQDVLGITQMVIQADLKYLELFSLSDRCRAVKKSWLSKLASLSGAALKYEYVIGCVFPNIWPDNPVTHRFFSDKKQCFDIVQYPPVSGSNGRVVIRYPAENIEVSIKWNDDRVSPSLRSSLTMSGEWRKCKELSIFDMMLR